MKKGTIKAFGIVCLTVAFVYGCTRLDTPSPEEIEKTPATKHDQFFVSESQAVQMLESVTDDVSSGRETRTAQSTRKVKKLTPIKGDDGNVISYVATYEGRKGWTMLSADRRAVPVIAYSESGPYDEHSQNPGEKVWFSWVKESMKRAKRDTVQSSKARALWALYDKEAQARIMGTSDCRTIYDNFPSNVDVEHLTAQYSRWSQEEGYNNYIDYRDCGPCNRARPGCGPVAVAQVLRYHKRPATFEGFSFTDAVYEAMPQMLSGVCDPTNAAEQSVGKLIRLAADGVNAQYYALNCQSFNTPGNIDDFFLSLGFNSYDRDLYSNREAINTELKARRPVIASGTTGGVNLWDWHIWVIDGIRVRYFVEQYTDGCLVVNPPDPRLGIKGERTQAICCRINESTYWQMNWGWSSPANDNWYSTSVHISEGGSEYDTYMKAYIVRP